MSILDVSCGSSVFMNIASKIPGVKVLGLDTTMESVQDCRLKGLTAYAMTLDEFRKEFPDEKFDYVVSFHCLEHVDQPKLFLQSMLSVAKLDGKVLVSTPHSPMSFEAGWFDILNYPPHHMTRWNISAYAEVARQLGCRFKYFMPNPAPLLNRTAKSFRLAASGKIASTSKVGLVLNALSHPIKFTQVLTQQLARPRINGKVSADVILVQLEKQSTHTARTGC